MRSLFRLLGTRYGISLGVILAVAAVVLIGRAVGGSIADSSVHHGAPALASPTGPPDDGDASLPTPQQPSTSPGAPTPSQVAMSFARAWTHTVGVTATAWRAGITKLTTTELAAQFDGVDPSSVPASKVTGEPTVIPHAIAYVEVTVPTDQGTLDLGLRATNGQWLVDSVDWNTT